MGKGEETQLWLKRKVVGVFSENHKNDMIEKQKKNLVRFAHNWNNGMVEMWNDGFKENET
jgi:hypothetical protein